MKDLLIVIAIILLLVALGQVFDLIELSGTEHAIYYGILSVLILCLPFIKKGDKILKKYY